jgi:hypothetical protein
MIRLENGLTLTGADARYLLLDQTTPQTIINTGMSGQSVQLMDGTYAINATGTTWLNGGYIGKVTTVDDTYQILVTDATVICNKSIAFTVTLPTAVVGQKFTIKNIGVGIVTVYGSGTDTIDGSLTQTVNQWESMQLQCYVANAWGVL